MSLKQSTLSFGTSKPKPAISKPADPTPSVPVSAVAVPPAQPASPVASAHDDVPRNQLPVSAPGPPAPDQRHQPPVSAPGARPEAGSDDDDIVIGALAGAKRSRDDAKATAAAAGRDGGGIAVPRTAASKAPAKAAAKDADSSADEELDEVDEEDGHAKPAAAAPKAAAASKEAAAGTTAIAAAAADFHPLKAAAEWCPTGTSGTVRVPYSALVSVFGAIEATTKRLAIQAILCNCEPGWPAAHAYGGLGVATAPAIPRATAVFRTIIALSPEDLLPVLYLCTNSLTPAYVGLELGVGDSILTKALAESTGRRRGGRGRPR